MKEPNATSQYQLLPAKYRVAWRSKIFLVQVALYKRPKAPILKARLNSWQCGFLRAYLFLPFTGKCLQKIEYVYTNKPYQNNYLQYCTVLSPLTTPHVVFIRNYRIQNISQKTQPLKLVLRQIQAHSLLEANRRAQYLVTLRTTITLWNYMQKWLVLKSGNK